jgi:hypothetical protein
MDKMQVVNLQSSVVARQYWPTTVYYSTSIGLLYNTRLYWLNILAERIVKFESFSYVQLEKRLKRYVLSSRREAKNYAHAVDE